MWCFCKCTQALTRGEWLCLSTSYTAADMLCSGHLKVFTLHFFSLRHGVIEIHTVGLDVHLISYPVKHSLPPKAAN